MASRRRPLPSLAVASASPVSAEALLAVIDIGTGTVRAQIVDADGGVHGMASRPQLGSMEPGWAEVETDGV